MKSRTITLPRYWEDLLAGELVKDWYRRQSNTPASKPSSSTDGEEQSNTSDEIASQPHPETQTERK